MINILCDLERVYNILEQLELSYDYIGKIKVSDLDFNIDESYRFYFSKKEYFSKDFDAIQLNREAIWKLDKLQNSLYYKKEYIHINGVDYLIYVRRETFISNCELESPQKIISYCTNELQLKRCDIYLMIPGKVDSTTNIFEQTSEINHELFNIFKENIENTINSEYSSDYLKNMQRKCISEITIKFNGINEQKTYFQNGLLCAVKHPTGFCILEIIIPCCTIGGNKLLNYYCGESISIKYGDVYYSINDILRALGIRRFGKKRSLVFSYGDTSKEELINALANEEYPMGKINGDFFKNISNKNIAQYDTAKVFVSSETILEICDYINVFPDKRILYHVIEIFFVEMILLQDAAIDKIHFDLQDITTDTNVDYAINRSEEINYEMTQALKFTDYNYFLFPTVRESAKVIALAFGIDHIYEKYEKDKHLIDLIIESSVRKTQEKQDIIKNRFLFLISSLTTIAVLGEIIHFLFEDTFASAFSYLSAIIIASFFYFCYKIVLAITKHKKK